MAGTTGSTAVANWVSGNAYNPIDPRPLASPTTAPRRACPTRGAARFFLPAGMKRVPVTLDVPTSKQTTQSELAAAVMALASCNTAGSSAVPFPRETPVLMGTRRIVREAYPVIMFRATYCSSTRAPHFAIQSGNAGDRSTVK